MKMEDVKIIVEFDSNGMKEEVEGKPHDIMFCLGSIVASVSKNSGASIENLCRMIGISALVNSMD